MITIHISDGVIYALLVLVWLKSMFVGSQFNIYLWIKYGKHYWNWYNETILNAKYTPER